MFPVVELRRYGDAVVASGLTSSGTEEYRCCASKICGNRDTAEMETAESRLLHGYENYKKTLKFKKKT